MAPLTEPLDEDPNVKLTGLIAFQDLSSKFDSVYPAYFANQYSPRVTGRL